VRRSHRVEDRAGSRDVVRDPPRRRARPRARHAPRVAVQLTPCS
jgi:hypothetical protein